MFIFHRYEKSIKNDNYPKPPMESILQLVFSSKMNCLLDGFSSYNKVLVVDQDSLKTNLQTNQGIYAYKKMPLSLINISVDSFERAMDISLKVLINHNMVAYLDDATIYSKNHCYHLQHLKQILECCREYGISHNPKKSIFFVTERKLLGHIILKKGTLIDPDKMNSITHILLPHNRKPMH